MCFHSNLGSIPHMRVSLCLIRTAGSWVCVAGSWREITSSFIVVLIDSLEN